MSGQGLFIPGRVPSLNEVLAMAKTQRGKYSPYNELKSAWTENTVMLAQNKRLVPMTGLVEAAFLICEPNERRDPDNFCSVVAKFVLDGLVKAGVIQGDGWKHLARLSYAWHCDPIRPGIRVMLTPYGA